MLRKYFLPKSTVVTVFLTPVPRPCAHSLLLAAGLVLAAGWVVGAGAQEKAGGAGKAEALPCPVDQVVKETRANNDKQGRGQPDSFYQRLAENYQKQCSKAETKISVYLKQLKEYRDGKRGDRDGYIILNQLWFNYQALRGISTPIFWTISKVSAGAESAVAGVAR